MIPNDRPEFRRSLTILAGIHGRKLDELTLEAYWKSVKGFALEQVLAGMERCVNEEKHFPSPAVLRAKMCVRDIPTFKALSFDDLPHGNDEHARLGFKLIGQITQGKMGPVKRLESFRYMAKKFPGVGWETAVTETEAIIARQGQP